MAITYHEKESTFHIYNKKISYIISILKNGQLGQLYYGKHIHDREGYGHFLELRKRPMAPCVYEDDATFSMEHVKQEYPSYGSGDMRYPAYEIAQKNGSRITELIYEKHESYQGKKKLEGLPHIYVEAEEEAQSLDIYLFDQTIGLEVIMTYSIFKNLPIITRSVRFKNRGADTLKIERAMSLSLDLPDMNYEMIELTGAWSRERSIKHRKLEHGIQAIYSMRGSSSSNYNPFLAVKRPETTQCSGEVYGFSLVYSGNFLAQIECDTYDITRITMGIHPDRFSWPLKSGEIFQSPEAVLVYSEEGLNGMSGAFHKLFRSRLARGIWRDEPRPILINNWEATYFNFKEDKIIEIALAAKELGIELFVLDDGWFGKRDDDTTSLGDWYPDIRKLPEGVTGIANKINDMGMKFGLWFEPEMINEESELYKKHPDWILSTPERKASLSRNQYVLDFSRFEVVDAIYQQIETVLSETSVSYIKWDMNRCMTEVYSKVLSAEEQGMVMHRYMLGVYRLYEKLITKFPDILFESCASGGGRFDPGMLFYAPQCWTSDDTDAVERLKIQYGTSMVYPLSSMGTHVSAVPNHQNFRQTPLNTRANVAYFGTFGYELDLSILTLEEKEVVKQQVLFMKKYRRLLQQGDFYRLLSPFEGNITVWMVVSEDKREAIVEYYRVLRPINVAFSRVRLQGLGEDLQYCVTVVEADREVEETKRYGDELMYSGLLVSDSSSGENMDKNNGSNGDYYSRIYLLRAK